MAMGTVPCLLWKWWTWWVVLREEDTLAATAGHGNTSSARESTSLKRKAGLAHTTGDTTAGWGNNTNPSSTSTSTSACCPIGAGPRKKKRPLPLIRHKQEKSISEDSRAHCPLLSTQGNEIKGMMKIYIFLKPIDKNDPSLKIAQKSRRKYKLLLKERLQDSLNSLVQISKSSWLDPREAHEFPALNKNTSP